MSAPSDRRVAFDTGVLVSAAIRPGSVPALALHKAMLHFTVCISTETFAELVQVLERPKFDAWLPLPLRRAFVAGVRQHAVMVEVTALVTDCADPKDNKFLALAEAAAVEVLVASDPHLTSLHPWRGIPIVPPAAFLVAIA